MALLDTKLPYGVRGGPHCGAAGVVPGLQGGGYERRHGPGKACQGLGGPDAVVDKLDGTGEIVEAIRRVANG